MARFHGPVGIVQSVEDPVDSGIFVDQITELQMFGDVIRNSRRMESGDQVNDSLVVENTISVVCDYAAIESFLSDIKYVEWVGKRWKVESIELQPPRLLLRLGSVYNGPTFTAP